MVGPGHQAMRLIPLVPAETVERQRRRDSSGFAELWNILDAVKDPEIPALSIWDIGILRDVVLEDQRPLVTITPTYSGCPAMEQIGEDIDRVMSSKGYAEARVVSQLAPAWTTLWMTPEAQTRLREYGIAAPDDVCGHRASKNPNELEVFCPICGSGDTRILSEFGSTSCKALLQCNSCHEPFDYFKRI